MKLNKRLKIHTFINYIFNYNLKANNSFRRSLLLALQNQSSVAVCNFFKFRFPYKFHYITTVTVMNYSLCVLIPYFTLFNHIHFANRAGWGNQKIFSVHLYI